MHELTLHVKPIDTEELREIVTVETNFMSDKIAGYLSFISDWEIRNGVYYNAVTCSEKLYGCLKGLNILLDMSLEPFMRRQISQVFKLIEELCWKIEQFKVQADEGLYDRVYLRWRCD